jgi:hypothetical protein
VCIETSSRQEDQAFEYLTPLILSPLQKAMNESEQDKKTTKGEVYREYMKIWGIFNKSWQMIQRVEVLL